MLVSSTFSSRLRGGEEEGRKIKGVSKERERGRVGYIPLP